MQGAVEIPDKIFFRIGEVARLTGVKPHVLRYWEGEFRGLRPKKSPSGQRRYRRTDVELVLQIKGLLWDRKFTHDGARAELVRVRRSEPSATTAADLPSEDSAAAAPVTRLETVVERVVEPDPATVAALEESKAALTELAFEIRELRALVQRFGGSL